MHYIIGLGALSLLIGFAFGQVAARVFIAIALLSPAALIVWIWARVIMGVA